MYEVIELLKTMCGLNATPTTMMEFIVWFVCMMFGVAVLSGMLEMVWYTATHAKGMFK